MKRVVITGATGMIGMALINKCIEEDMQVVALVNPDSPRNARIPSDPHVAVIKCGLGDLAHSSPEQLQLDPLKDGTYADAMFHLAWGGTVGDDRNNRALQERNVSCAVDAAGLAARLGCKVFTGAGSQAEYGRVSKVLTADTPCYPENEYGRAKLKASELTGELCRTKGIRHIWARILSVYGPYNVEDTMIMSLIRQLLEGRRPSLTAGEQMWDYLYASDAARALLLMAEHGRDGSIYPVGSGLARPLREYIKIIRDAIDPSLPLGFGQKPYQPGQVMYLCADISQLEADTGFKPEVSFEEGIRLTIDYVRNTPL